MKFSFDKEILLKEIEIAREIVAARAPLSILSNILLIAKNNILTIRTTDLKIEFETTIPVQIEKEGETTVFCDKFVNIIASLPNGEVEIERKEEKIIIKSNIKKARFQLKTISEKDYPAFTQINNPDFFNIPSKEFKNMIKKTIFSVSDDETRLFLNGIFIEKKDKNLVFVASDGRRLAFCKNEFEIEKNINSCIIPTKILSIINKHLSDEGIINIAITEKNIFFEFDKYHFSSVLLEGNFPDYNKVIPESQVFSFEIEKGEFLEALKRVSLLVERKTCRIFFTVNPGTLTIMSQETEMGLAKEEIPCKYDGETFTFAINYRYFEEPLKEMSSDRVKVEFTEILKPLSIYPEPKENFFYIAMPMQME